jgi:hypothetical protein
METRCPLGERLEGQTVTSLKIGWSTLSDIVSIELYFRLLLADFLRAELYWDIIHEMLRVILYKMSDLTL